MYILLWLCLFSEDLCEGYSQTKSDLLWIFMKVNGRVILGIFLILLPLAIVFSLSISYRSGMLYGTAADPAVQMPWEGGVRLYGADYFVYLYNAIDGTYAHYPWTV